MSTRTALSGSLAAEEARVRAIADVVRRCKLDPNLKAPGFNQPNEEILAFNLNLVSELVPLQRGKGGARLLGG